MTTSHRNLPPHKRDPYWRPAPDVRIGAAMKASALQGNLASNFGVGAVALNDGPFQCPPGYGLYGGQCVPQTRVLGALPKITSKRSRFDSPISNDFNSSKPDYQVTSPARAGSSKPGVAKMAPAAAPQTSSAWSRIRLRSDVNIQGTGFGFGAGATLPQVNPSTNQPLWALVNGRVIWNGEGACASDSSKCMLLTWMQGGQRKSAVLSPGFDLSPYVTVDGAAIGRPHSGLSGALGAVSNTDDPVPSMLGSVPKTTSIPAAKRDPYFRAFNPAVPSMLGSVPKAKRPVAVRPLADPCNEDDADYDQWECIKQTATGQYGGGGFQSNTAAEYVPTPEATEPGGINASEAANVIPAVVMEGGLLAFSVAAQLATLVFAYLETVYPTDVNIAKNCLADGGMWDVRNRVCYPLNSEDGRRVTCEQAGGRWRDFGNGCVLPADSPIVQTAEQAGVAATPAPPLPAKYASPSQVVVPSPARQMPPQPVSASPAPMSTTTKVLLGVGAVATIAAAAAGALYLAKKR